jgi:hypothetical protein
VLLYFLQEKVHNFGLFKQNLTVNRYFFYQSAEKPKAHRPGFCRQITGYFSPTGQGFLQAHQSGLTCSHDELPGRTE